MQREEELVHRAQRHDAGAFGQLYEEHFDRIYRYIVLRVRNEADAEDLTQQVFLKALEHIGSYHYRGMPFASWLFRIAHNQVVDHWKKKSREKVKLLTQDEMAEAGALSDDDPAALAEQTGLSIVLRRIKVLPVDMTRPEAQAVDVSRAR